MAKPKKEEYIWSLLRICLGWIFLWAFLDKLFGLGFNTASDKSWILGVSPTSGFLNFAADSVFAPAFKALAGSVIIDFLFMLGLLFIGAALIFGIATKLAGYAGSLLLFLMWLALVPPEHNPILDEHIIYLLVLIGIAKGNGQAISLRKWWNSTRLVRKHKLLE